jgi:hypothetical protein
MACEEARVWFAQSSGEQRKRVTEEVGLELCKEIMSDSAFMERKMPRCLDMMGQMPEPIR